jgi:tetratricopeptide (TPR) repeat protein
MLVLGLLAAALAVLGGVAARAWSAHHVREELAAARREMEAGLYNLAEARLDRLASVRSDRDEIDFERGRCEAARDHPEAALSAWARVASDSPWGAPSALAFTQTALPMGRIASAERLLRASLNRRVPELPAVRRMLLNLLGEQGRVVEARRLIESLWRDTAMVPAGDLADRLVMLREHAGLDLEPMPLEWNLNFFSQGPAPTDDEDRRAMALVRAYLATRSGDFPRAKDELRWCLERRPDDPLAWKSWLDGAVAAGRSDSALEALGHVPAGLLDGGEILELQGWLARQQGDPAAERRALESLVAMEPGRTAAMTRLAELLRQAGDADVAAGLVRRKADLDAALDRYLRLYKEDRYAEHLPELAALAERLGRRFEARAAEELIATREPSNPDARPAPARLESSRLIRPEPPASSTLDQVLKLDRRIGPAARPEPDRRRVPRFEEDAATAGLADFVQDNGASPLRQLPETFSGGVGLLDYDGDGFLDLYCVQGGAFPPGPSLSYPGDRLYRNRGDGTFEDVTHQAGIAGMPRGYGHGVAVGDYDNDGRPDLFITRWRAYALYRNRGDGTFEDRTVDAGLGGDRDWPTSSAFADLDDDGDLDLYVCHYGLWDAANPPICQDPAATRNIVCDPRSIASLPDHVFRNDGGRFVDVTSRAGFVDRDGRGLGVVAADLDGDGRIDLYVANDSTANFLYRNRGGFRFEEVGHEAGVAANAGGGYQAGMGVACGDLDGDGRLDLAVTNYYGESTTFFHNLGQGLFTDHTAAIGLAAPSRHRLGFGAAFLDADNDGRLDLMTANGHVGDNRPLFPYAMPAQLFLGGPAGSLTDVSAAAGPPFQKLYVGRGLAAGDVDNDGRTDAVIVAHNDPIAFFHNRTDDLRDHSITFRLEGTRSNRDGVGALVTVEAGGRRRIAPRLGGGSYQSAGDPRVHFGLGPSDRVDRVEIRWPSGQSDRYGGLAADRGYRLREGDPTPRILEGFRSPPSPTLMPPRIPVGTAQPGASAERSERRDGD